MIAESVSSQFGTARKEISNGHARCKVLYIAGANRSGTTLLGRVIGQAESATCPGELYLTWQRGVMDNEPCSCGLPFLECPYWTAVFRDAFANIRPGEAQDVDRAVTGFDDYAAWLRLTWAVRKRRATAPVTHLDAVNRLFEVVRAIHPGQMIVDTSKRAKFALMIALLPDIDLRVVHVVRDSRAVACSLRRSKVRVQIRDRALLMSRGTASQSARRWLRENLFSESLAWAGIPSLRVRYEDFCTDPVGTLRIIGEFAAEDLTTVPFVGAREVALSTDHIVSGNPVRTAVGPVSIRTDDEWLDKLPGLDRALVTGLTLPMLLRYGYVGRPMSRT